MTFKGLQPILYGGREVWPLVEGGKGVSATNHASSGAWAAAGGIGTVSAVNADSYDAEGKIIPQIYDALTRKERHEQLIRYAIDGAVEQVRRAYDVASGTRNSSNMPSTAPLRRSSARMMSPGARARSTSTCCGKWGVPRGCCTASSNGPRGWSAA